MPGIVCSGQNEQPFLKCAFLCHCGDFVLKFSQSFRETYREASTTATFDVVKG